MKKLAIVLLALNLWACQSKRIEKKRVLIIVSNVKDMGDTDKHFAGNNLWEVAPPYHIFVSHGYAVDFASPTGGKVPFSMNPIGISSYTIKHEGFMNKAQHSLKPEQIDYKKYAAVFIGGGYGTLFDVAKHPKLLATIAQIYQNKGVVGGCGHGPGAFANVKLSNGEYMVKGKKVAGFPNATEKTKSWAKKGSLLPFLLEDKLRENGAIFQSKKELADKHAVVKDQSIVSTMFLPSAALVAKEMINEIEGRETKLN